MKFLKKTLSVGLSLVLCASMTVPAFAAVAFDKDVHVDGAGVLQSHKETVNGNEVDSYDYFLSGDVELDKTLVIKDGAASIDLNGYNLSLNKDQQVNTATGEVTGNEKTGSVISVTGDKTTLTVTDKNADADYEHGTGTGTISGGYIQPQHGEGFGGGIKVDGNASLDLKGGTITNNAANNGGGVYVGKGTVTMSGDAKIDGNLAAHNGGGVFLNTELASRTGNQAVFTMNGGIISNNTASGKNASGNIGGGGGGIGAVLYQESPDPNYVAIQINKGTITGNKAEVSGAGISVTNGRVSISNSTITGNIAKNIQGTGTLQRGGGIFASGSKTEVTVTNSTISGNEATQGGGVYLQQNGRFVMSSGKLYGNSATGYADDVYKGVGAILKLPSAVSMGVEGKDENGNNITQDGKDITGWYWDGSGVYSWGDKEDGSSYYATQNNNATVNAETDRIINTALSLKAAHNQYFNVSYYLDENAEDSYQDFEAEKGFALPKFEVENPEREGYTFGGWELVEGIDKDGNVTGEVKYVAQWTRNETPTPTPDEPGTTIEDPDVPLGDELEVDIDDPAVPLASGPVTRAQFVDYLWRHEGEPAPVQDDGLFEDVTDEHEYSTAMAWAKSIGIIEAYEDGTFEPDELVTVSAVRSILTRFAAYADMTMPALTTLTGAEDEAVLNCDEVLAEFFGEEYTSAKSEDIDIAA